MKRIDSSEGSERDVAPATERTLVAHATVTRAVATQAAEVAPLRMPVAEAAVAEVAPERVGIISRIQLEADPIVSRHLIVTKRLPSAPLSASGTLNTHEVYTDPKEANVAYLLPEYRVVLAAGKPQVQLELTPDLPHAGRLLVKLDSVLHTRRRPLRPVLVERPQAMMAIRLPIDGGPIFDPRPLPIERRPIEPQPQPIPTIRYQPLPHDVSLSLRFLAGETTPSAERMSTWKSVSFDQIRQEDERHIDAVATLHGLAEFDAVFRALAEPLAQAELVVNCRAMLAVQMLLGRTAWHGFEPGAPLLRALPGVVSEHGILAPRGDALAPLRRVESTQIVTASCDQRVAVYYDPLAYPEIFPPRQPGSGATLVRFAVNDQVLFQDTLERHVFYFLPDEFRLSRDDVRSPTYKPSLWVDFFSVESTVPGMEAYGVRLGFRAVPYLAPYREHDAQRYIQEHALVPNGRPATLLPLMPEWAQLTLTLPDELGNAPRLEVRAGANIEFDKSVTDSLLLTPAQFEEVFSAMLTSRDTLNGAVKYKHTASSVEHAIPFSGRLDKLVGPSIDISLVGATSNTPGEFRVRLDNGLESAVALKALAIYLIEDPLTGKRVLASTAPSVLPLSLAPGQSVEFDVRAPLSAAFGARVVLLEHEVNIDVAALWLSILDTPGWDGVVQSVDVSVDGSYFSGPRAGDRVAVQFNAAEATLELTQGQPNGTVRLVRPLLAYLMKRQAAQEYFYQVEVWRKPDASAEALLVASSPLARHSGPVLPIAPPPG